MEKELTWKLCWYLLTHGLLAWVQISFPFLTLKLGTEKLGSVGTPTLSFWGFRGTGDGDWTHQSKAGGVAGSRGDFGYSHHSLVRALGAGGVTGHHVVPPDPSGLEVEAALVWHGWSSWGTARAWLSLDTLSASSALLLCQWQLFGGIPLHPVHEANPSHQP